jgi:NADPH-dependent curcumin reductase CurA
MAIALTNRQYRLAARPEGLPKPTDWSVTEEAVAQPADGQALVQNLYVSLDPAMRGWMNDRRSYIRPVGIGDVMRAIAVGRVVESRIPSFVAGDYVTGAFGVQEYALTDGRGVLKVDPDLAPLPVFLSALGTPGLSAYFGLLDVAKPQAGETVVVSAAAGAVGQVVGQIAKIKGCRAVGIAGGPEKCRFIVDELGFNAGIDYKAGDLRAALKEQCPDRVHVYFDNVGGDVLDTVLTLLARRARIVICGSISQYNADGPMRGPAHYMSLLVDRARMEGFVVFDYADRYLEAIVEMGGWRTEGKLKSREDIVAGLEAFPNALLKLFRGENFGKLILQIGSE